MTGRIRFQQMGRLNQIVTRLHVQGLADTSARKIEVESVRGGIVQEVPAKMRVLMVAWRSSPMTSHLAERLRVHVTM
jgi:hypothetical protein